MKYLNYILIYLVSFSVSCTSNIYSTFCGEPEFCNINFVSVGKRDSAPSLMIQAYELVQNTRFNFTIPGSSDWQNLQILFHVKGKDGRCTKYNRNDTEPWNLDCRFYEDLYESLTYIVKVQTEGESTKLGEYIFVSPKSKGLEPDAALKDVEIFIYAEIADLANPVLHIQKAHFESNIVQYVITIYKGNNKSTVFKKFNIKDENFEKNGVYTYDVDADLTGELQLCVTPINALNISGTESCSIVIKKDESKIFLILIIILTLLPIYVMIICLWKYIRRQNFVKKQAELDAKYPACYENNEETPIVEEAKPDKEFLMEFDFGEGIFNKNVHPKHNSENCFQEMNLG